MPIGHICPACRIQVVETFHRPLMSMATCKQLQSKLGGSDIGIVDKRKEFEFESPDKQSKIREMFQIAVDLYEIVASGNAHHFIGTATERASRNLSGCRHEFFSAAARCSEDARMSRCKLAEQVDEGKIRPDFQ